MPTIGEVIVRIRLGIGLGVVAVLAMMVPLSDPSAADLTETIKRVKPGVVAIGTYQMTRRPPAQLLGTGFAVADGRHIVTSAHVLPETIAEQRGEFVAVFATANGKTEALKAQSAAVDAAHDVAILKIDGPALPALRLGDDDEVQEGQNVAFTGFPIGAVLGLHAATHRGIVSAITPISIPQLSARQLDVRMIRQLREGLMIFQLDATAYPGNSGSPLYDAQTGAVYGVVNSVFVKKTKERVLQDPSGITYATPIRHAKALLRRLGFGQ